MKRVTSLKNAQILSLAVAGVTFAVSQSAHGQTVTWLGTNRVLTTATYWNGGAVPTSTEEAYFNNVEQSSGVNESLGFKGTSANTTTTFSLNVASLVFDDSQISPTNTLDIGSSISASAPGIATLTVNGNGSGSSDIIELTSNVTGEVDFTGADAVSGSPLTITLNTGQLDVESSTASLNFDSVVTGSSGVITKVGAGEVKFSSTSTVSYSGGINVTAGTLVVNGLSNQTSNPYTVSGTGSLGGYGTIDGAVSLTTGAPTLAPGGTQTSLVAAQTTLTVPSLTLSGSSTTTFAIDHTVSTNANDVLAVASGGAITFGGTLAVTDLDTGSGVNSTTFNLFNFSGSESGTFSTINLPTAPAGYMWENFGAQPFNYGNGDIVLVPVSVPEPIATSALLLVGFAAGFRRRRKLGQ